MTEEKSGKQAMGDLQSTLREATRLAERAVAIAASGASRKDKQRAVEEARDAIDHAKTAKIHAYHASTSTNPDSGTPMLKKMLASAVTHASKELDAADRKIGLRGIPS